MLAIIGGGPAGLAAAETAARAGAAEIVVYDAMASVGRKFLMAGKGGLNLTHSEPLGRFLTRYGAREAALTPMIQALGPDQLRAWAEGLGIATFVGSSRRVFPAEMKAAPLLRAWLRQLKAAGVMFKTRHRWLGWDGAALRFAIPAGEARVTPDAVVLALGGASWPELGSDAAWMPLLRERGVDVAPFRPANCGFDVGWSDHFRERFAGAPLKSIAAWVEGSAPRRGECVVTDTGIEGGVVYSLSRALRDKLDAGAASILMLDLAPAMDAATLSAAVARPRGKASFATHLRKSAGIAGVKAGLLREVLSPAELANAQRVAAAIKTLPLRLAAARPLAEAISSAGGVRFEDLDRRLMVKTKPGLFIAGEMLDWEAPTGGYLLTACFATGAAAGAGAAAWLKARS